MNRRFVLLALLVLVVATAVTARAETRLLRFPAIHADRVAFTYGGDLWAAPASGGTATRLTAHPGVEAFARFSPDGQWIAFTGQYDGDEQVYVMPAGGGEPRQLTFYPARGPLAPRWGYDNQVFGWTPDGKGVVFRSLRDSWTLPVARLYVVPVDGGLPAPLPMPEAGSGAYSPDGTKMVYSPQSRDFRSEKRYGGGQANDLYIFDLKTNETTVVADHVRADRDPMWVGSRIYFTSDRDGTFNLYAYDLGSRQTTAVTTGRQWDVRWPSADGTGRIVYEVNGGLQVLDVASGRSTPISITVPDDGLWKRPSRVSAAGQISDFELSPKGERALVAARGDIFTLPIEKGAARNLTMSSGAHDKWPRWSPDGSRIAFISDRTGEEDVWVVPQDGSGPAERLTTGMKVMLYAPEWSPDGSRIAVGDKDGRIHVIDVASKKVTEVYDAVRGQIRDYTWAPRERHLAFSTGGRNGVSSIYIWSESDGRVRRVTDPLFNAARPAWDPDGHYLFFTSTREFAPQISQVEFNFASARSTLLYALPLRKDVAHPFPPQSDEVTVGGSAESAAPDTKPAGAPPANGKTAAEAAAKKGGDTAAKKEAPASPLIDFDGLEGRATRVPLDADNYGALSAKKGHLVYAVGGGFYYGRQSDRRTALRIYSLKDRKETTLVDDIQGYALSRDGSKVLVRQGPGFNLFDATPTGANSKKAVSTAGLVVDRVPTEEWTQIFNEVWRRYRDWFYVPNMHGYDWEALRKQYTPWLAHVAHRSDLNYVISEMIAELTVQHAYIEGGDMAMPARPRVALPGARFEADAASGRYRIARILPGQNEEATYRSPLTEVGVDAREGDYILAIDGVDLTTKDNPYRLLRHKGDRPVTLTVNATPSATGARTITFNPVTSEDDLLYLEWVLGNRKRVDELSGGRLAYLHIPDMGANGIREFIKWYYPQLDKEGLVVDVRANGGGNVSRMIIERLRRTPLSYGYSRTDDVGTTYPDGTFLGPKIAILDRNSASDGDIFPYMFKKAGLGPLVGKRSWGGVVGITNRGPLIDGGSVSVPEFGFADTTPEWVIEGYGVDPDIDVDNDPRSVLAGRDPQLERAVEELMKQLQGRTVGIPPRPAPPVKTETPK